MHQRGVPLVLVASSSAALAESVAAQLRREGDVVYVAHSADGALRVATSLGPDLVLLDPTFPPRLERLLKAHPMTAESRILHLSASAPATTHQVTQTSARAGPHAA